MISYLECPHCGCEGMASDAQGLFCEDDEGDCLHCGIRVRVYCDDDGYGQVSGYLTQIDPEERCRQRRCVEGCGYRGPVYRHANRAWLARVRAMDAVAEEVNRRGISHRSPEASALYAAVSYRPVAHRKRYPGEVRHG